MHIYPMDKGVCFIRNSYAAPGGSKIINRVDKDGP